MSRPDNLSAVIHAGHRLLLAHLDHGRALVVAKRNSVRALATSNRPDPLHSVVERVL